MLRYPSENLFMDFKSRYFLFIRRGARVSRGWRSQSVQQTVATYICLQSFQFKLFIFSSKLCVNTKLERILIILSTTYINY